MKKGRSTTPTFYLANCSIHLFILTSNRITFSLELIHFSPEIIDSVIIHELAHDFYRDHSIRFYNVVYQYCPNYDSLRNKMVKGEFK